MAQQGYKYMEAFLDKTTGNIIVNKNIEHINIQPNNMMYIINTKQGYQMTSLSAINYSDISSGNITYLKAVMLTKVGEVLVLAEWNTQTGDLMMQYEVGLNALISLYNRFNIFRSVGYSVMLFSGNTGLKAIFKSASEAVAFVKNNMVDGEPFKIELISKTDSSSIAYYDNNKRTFVTKVYINNDIKTLYNFYANNKVLTNR